MKKLTTLLVPTDFSAPAKAAAHYAAKLALQIHAKVILLSVIEMETSETILHNWKVLENQMKKSAIRDLQKLLKEVKASVGETLDITCDIATGIPMHEAIDTYARKQKVNMIIMGTKGATGLAKILRGTNTSRLIEHSSLPVIAVPPKVTYTPMKKMVYATDLKNTKAEIKTLAALAELFQAEILVLHCTSPDAKTKLDKKIETDLIKQSEYRSISFHEVKAAAIDKAIGQFVEEHKADMLVMFTHELDFYDRLFGTSITRNVAFQSRIPLLAYNRTKS